MSCVFHINYMFWIKAVAKIPAVNGTAGSLQLQGLCSPQQLIPKALTQQRSQSRNGVIVSGTGSGPLILLPSPAPAGTSAGTHKEEPKEPSRF